MGRALSDAPRIEHLRSVPTPGARLGTPVRGPAHDERGLVTRDRLRGASSPSFDTPGRGRWPDRTCSAMDRCMTRGSQRRAPVCFPTRGHLKGATRSVANAQPVSCLPRRGGFAATCWTNAASASKPDIRTMRTAAWRLQRPHDLNRAGAGRSSNSTIRCWCVFSDNVHQVHEAPRAHRQVSEGVSTAFPKLLPFTACGGKQRNALRGMNLVLYAVRRWSGMVLASEKH